MHPLSRFLKYVAGSVVIVILILLMGCFAFFKHAEPAYQGQARINGLTQAVRVYRDQYGIPHIFAATMNDAAHALGYVHAGDRFFQMEMQRRAGQGRLSEIIGPSMLGVDKFIRTLGLYALAQSSYQSMSPEAQEFFQSYADGVNAWLSTHSKSLPPELMLLQDQPEVWRPADSVVWGKLMALQLSQNYKLELLRGELGTHVSQLQLQQLFPDLAVTSPITTAPRLLQKSDQLHPQQDALEQLGLITSLAHGASNEWVISGGRTETGKPILANDPHLDLEAPILWYLARLVTPELTLKGATVPGLPLVLLGQNDHIAWGFTTTGSDVQDLFVETLDPKNSQNYLTPEGSIPFKTRTEIIHIKHAADVVVTVRSTRHGPVLSDIDAAMAQLVGPGKVMALSFTGLGDHDTTSEALMHLDRARDWTTFRSALKLYQAPPQNVVFADHEGNIGFINPGWVPIRKSGEGLIPSDGASGAYDWIGMVPFDELPQGLNPKAGFYFNANNAVVDHHASHFYGQDWDESFRAQRLQQFFDSISRHTLASSAMMQADHISLAARALLPYLQRVQSHTPLVQEALQLLYVWDGTMDKDRPEPLLFEAWLYQMHQLLLVAKSGQNLEAKGPFGASTLASILKNNPAPWCDGDASCAAVISQAMKDAVDMLVSREQGPMISWRWGHEHVTVLKHKVFSHIPGLASLIDLSVPSSGDFYTLDRGGSFNLDPDHPFVRTHGGGYRGLYDLNDPTQSRFMITTGESGHVLSEHYGDLVPLWNDVKGLTLTGSVQEFEQQGRPVFVLEPANL